MSYAIMRCKKLRGHGSVAASLQHCYRERPTHNADPERTASNEHYEAVKTTQAMGRLRALLPEKHRKDAVLTVEYMMTASPEWWQSATKDEQAAFFERSLQWLKDKYGAQNVFAATVHRDETTPHLSAYVVPVTADGRLSAKDYIGNRSKMQRDQSTFAAAVADLGLERGIEGSKASHVTIKEYYARAKAAVREIPVPEVPEPSLAARFNPKEYGKEVRKATFRAVLPYIRELEAKAALLPIEQQKAKEARQTLDDWRDMGKPIFDSIRTLTKVDDRKECLSYFGDFAQQFVAKKLVEADRREMAALRQAAQNKLEAARQAALTQPLPEPAPRHKKPQKAAERDDDHDLSM